MADDADPPVVPPRQIRPSTDVSQLPYFHPHCKNLDEVREIMIPYVLKDGYFLLRKSFSKPGVLTVSVMHEKSIKHFNIFQRGSSFYLHDKHFPSVDQLVKHYSQEDVPNVEGVKNVRLRLPIKFIPDLPPSPAIIRGPRNGRLDYRNQSERSGASFNSPVTPSLSPLFIPRNSAHPLNCDISVGEEETKAPKQATSCGANGKRYTPKSVSSEHLKTLKSLFKRNKKQDTISEVVIEKEVTMRDRCKSDSLDHRPPAPEPEDSSPRTSSISSLESSLFYSRVRDVEKDMSEMLLADLAGQKDTCECGLSEYESELPRGWSMHICRESQQYGRIFFMDAEGTSHWHLPMEVSLELTRDQQERIKAFLEKFQTRSVNAKSKPTETSDTVSHRRPSNNSDNGQFDDDDDEVFL